MRVDFDWLRDEDKVLGGGAEGRGWWLSGLFDGGLWWVLLLLLMLGLCVFGLEITYRSILGGNLHHRHQGELRLIFASSPPWQILESDELEIIKQPLGQMIVKLLFEMNIVFNIYSM